MDYGWMYGWGWWRNGNINQAHANKLRVRNHNSETEVCCCRKFDYGDWELGEVSEKFQKSSKDDSKGCDIFRVC